MEELMVVRDQHAGARWRRSARPVGEDVAGDWLKRMLGLPGHASVNFVSGGLSAQVVCLAAARDHVLRLTGWDVGADGLVDAPPLRVLAGADRHHTVNGAARLLGLGTAAVVGVGVDARGRLRPDDLRIVLQEHAGPAIVCTRVGYDDTGAVDPVGEICDVAYRAGVAWVHVDAAVDLRTVAGAQLRPLPSGVECADSWAIDVPGLPDVPAGSGLAVCAHPDAYHPDSGRGSRGPAIR